MLRRIRDDIETTCRPTSQSNPPSEFGSARHGKLTADQWRTILEFDAPVSLLKMWSERRSNSTNAFEQQIYGLLMDNRMYLAIAVAWGTSRRTSHFHAEKYKEFMVAYLDGLKLLGFNLVPNHHLALHLSDFLTRFGPAHGWWAFPFERLIRVLGHIRTNSKIGAFSHS